MATYNLDNWFVILASFKSKCGLIRLSGIRREDNSEVLTSIVKDIDGKVITTLNSAYILGEPGELPPPKGGGFEGSLSSPD